jgi:hypothetical protein
MHTIYKQTNVFVLVLYAKQQQQKKSSSYLHKQTKTNTFPGKKHPRAFFFMKADLKILKNKLSMNKKRIESY